MYSSWFYYILTIISICLFIKIFGPILFPLLIVYLIYLVIRNRQQIKAMRELHKASKVFQEEWDNVKQSEQYQSTQNEDVIDADYTIKED